jgi:hypothetical protein
MLCFTGADNTLFCSYQYDLSHHFHRDMGIEWNLHALWISWLHGKLKGEIFGSKYLRTNGSDGRVW